MYCPNCGKEIDESGEYCKYCGTRIERDTVESVQARPEEFGEDVPTYEPPKMIPLDMMERNERVVFETHPSIMEAFIKYIVGGILIIAGGIALMVVLGWGIVGWVLIGAGVIIGLIGFIKWRSVIYALTTHRIIVLRGIFSKHEHECRLNRVQDIMMRMSLGQRMLNYGNIYITTAGTSQVEIKWLNIPDPRKKQSLLRAALAR
ncbi:MAG: PH domain-containing protein [Dehalococcoidia bacterium]